MLERRIERQNKFADAEHRIKSAEILRSGLGKGIRDHLQAQGQETDIQDAQELIPRVQSAIHAVKALVNKGDADINEIQQSLLQLNAVLKDVRGCLSKHGWEAKEYVETDHTQVDELDHRKTNK